MKLESWRIKEGLSIQDLAERIGESYETTRRYITGCRRPQAAQMTKIYVVTGGAVTPNDFHELPDLKPARRRESAPAEAGAVR